MITLDKIVKQYKTHKALDNVSLEIGSNELVALLGPSGSGKTTLLRIIAGLDFANSGEIYFNGQNIHNKKISERKIGFVFQNYALFDHMTVFENIAFGLNIMPKTIRPHNLMIKEKVESLLKLMRLSFAQDRFPRQLSGGQRQRVALARALAIEPKILLLDEPFAALDSKVRKELRSWIRRLHNEMSITTIVVTHDQEEALEIADKVIIMNEGKIEQIGCPEEIYNQPNNSFVYDFMGDFNVFEGYIDLNGNSHIAEYDKKPEKKYFKYQPSWLKKFLLYFNLNFNDENVEQISKEEAHGTKGKLKIFARPYEMEVLLSPKEQEYYITTKLLHFNPAGPLVKLELERKDGSFIYAHISKEVYQELKLFRGQTLFVRPKKTTVFS